MVDGQTVFLTWDIFSKQEAVLGQSSEGHCPDKLSDASCSSDDISPQLKRSNRDAQSGNGTIEGLVRKK